jgi:hypothetical protein
MKNLALIVCFIHVLPAKGQGVSGISVDSNRLWYVEQNRMICLDIATSGVLGEKNLDQDTVMLNNLVEKSVNLYKIKGDSALKKAKQAIAEDIRIINLTIYNHSIYIGIRFQTSLEYYPEYRYAILAYDQQLRLVNFYIFCLSAACPYFTLPPYHEIEFANASTIVLPVHLSNNLTFDYCSMKLNKSHEVRFLTVKEGQVGIYGNMSVNGHKGLITEPLVYHATYPGGRIFYQYPFPVFNNLKNKTYLDPYHLKPGLDSMNALRFSRQKSFFFGSYIFDLDFGQASKKYKNIVLASTVINDTLFSVVSNKTASKTDLVYCDVRSGVCKINTIDFSPGNKYFFFRDNTLYVLSRRGKKASVSQLVYRGFNP